MLRRALTAATAALLLLLVAPLAPATAADGTPVVTFTLDPATVVQFVLAVALPIVVGLVTTRVTSAGAKAWLLAGLTLVTSLLVELGRVLEAGGTFDVGVALFLALPAFAISVATHYGLWKPTGVSAAAQDAGPRHRA